MKLIKRQFGAYFAHLLILSPTLQQDLKVMRKRGIRIRRVRNLEGAWCESGKKMIYIGMKNSYRNQLLHLAHELHHMLRGDGTADNKRTFVRRNLNEEVDAILAEIYVMEELIPQGIKFGYSPMLWYRRYKRGGRQALVKEMLKTRTSTTDELYSEFYSRQFDDDKTA